MATSLVDAPTEGWSPPTARSSPTETTSVDAPPTSRCRSSTEAPPAASTEAPPAARPPTTLAPTMDARPSARLPTALASAGALALALAVRALGSGLVRASLARACRVGLSNGLHGALAGVVQVVLLMWLRTTMNFQYAKGTGLRQTVRMLWYEGGVLRFYQGFWFAIIQAPLTRFGDVAANEGVRSLFAGSPTLAALPTSARSLVVSALAVGFRLLIHPLDSVKTNMQIYGPAAHAELVARVKAHGPRVLFDGCAAGTVSNFIGHVPYWITYNAIAPYAHDRPLLLAACALAATCVSDCFANTFRVLKTARQTMRGARSYVEVAREIVRTDGVRGLLGRALFTRMVTNSVQAVVFTLVLRWLRPAAGGGGGAAGAGSGSGARHGRSALRGHN